MKTYFGTCTTSANVATKIVELQNGETGVTFNENFLLSVYFHANNTINNELKMNLKLYGSNTYINSAAITIRNTLQEFASGSPNQDKRGDLTSWPAGTVVSFIYTQGSFYITNYRPITNISGILSDYVNKTGFRAAAEDSTNGLITTAYDTGNIPESAKIVTRGVSAFYTRPISQLIPYVHQEARVGYNGSYKADGTGAYARDPMLDISNDDYNWFLVAETKINFEPYKQGIHQDREIIFYVHDTQSNTNRGILKAHIRNYELGATPTLSLNWDYAKGYNVTDFVLITNGNDAAFNGGGSGATENNINITCQLYTRVSVNWQARIFDVISQGARTTTYNDDWTLYNWFGGPGALNQEQYRFKSPEDGFYTTTLTGTSVTLQSIFSDSLQYVIANVNVDLTQADNGVSAEQWAYALYFKDKHNLGRYGRIEAPVYPSGQVGLSLIAVNYAPNQEITNSEVVTSRAAITLLANKDNTSYIQISSGNLIAASSATDAKFTLKGLNKSNIHLWADDANTYPKYIRGAGLWYGYNNNSLVDNRRIIDYQPIFNNWNNPTQITGGKIFIGTDNPDDTIPGVYQGGELKQDYLDYIYFIGKRLSRKTIYSSPIAAHDGFGRTDAEAGTSLIHVLHIGNWSDVYLGSNNFTGPGDLFYVGASINVNTATNRAAKLNGYPVGLMVGDDHFYLATMNEPVVKNGQTEYTGWKVIWTIEADSQGYLKLIKNNSHWYWNNN